MSNRTAEQASPLAELRVAHEAQIEALTAPGLTDEERVRRFGEVVGFNDYQMRETLHTLSRASAARAVWQWRPHERSLFASLPDCECPVLEKVAGRANYPGIPTDVKNDPSWSPDRATLEAFARVQQAARFPEAAAS